VSVFFGEAGLVLTEQRRLPMGHPIHDQSRSGRSWRQGNLRLGWTFGTHHRPSLPVLSRGESLVIALWQLALTL
jgi:hypothetical protein